MAIKVKRSEAVKLFEALGCELAGDWKPDKMIESLKTVEDFYPTDDEFKLGDDLQALYDIVRDGADQEFELENDMKAAAKGGKKAAAPAKGQAPKPAPFKKPAAPPGPGVIGTILKILGDGSGEKPVTKDDIHAKLVKAFPKKDPDGMWKTITLQVPNRIGKERGVEVSQTKVTRKTADGTKKEVRAYWVEVIPEGAIQGKRAMVAAGTAAPKPKPKPAPAKPQAAKSGAKPTPAGAKAAPGKKVAGAKPQAAKAAAKK